MQEEKEYITFTITAQNGTEVELAVLSEFEFEKKTYVAAAKVENDTILEDGVYLYRIKLSEEDFQVEKITNHVEYERVCKAYMEMEEDQ